ncbi:YbgA family protein [Thiothrix fructosivorans]|uniref:DUF523 and DUF1722 domain-containing protein n=1 Tax=Thiothrix fructosivorans TaxID=111770 RepID=A0A8B0SH30_9GAMM|nr:DUF523 and DUF1722 domain-containing protein [Thiothrix fructosivorans]MBO0615404.1 DUF523 and DUF1722 domain-containing protein [Thiothrix fructosivorans]QTX10175.1 DUF523 and DUF1722 domain-containing protein [Thiothrix fructosivorans]
MQHDDRIKIGISACLVGEQVRFDGGHKRDGYIMGTLGLYFDFVPLCPEVGAGLGVPRQTMHLVRKDGTVRAINTKDASIDHTDALAAYTHAAVLQLQGIHGYILKKNSPSCGMERVKVYSLENRNVPPERDGIGIFARGLREQFPLLPIEEEGRLCDPVLRENFIQRVFIYHRWQQLQAAELKPADLVAFHADHKYILMAHDQDMVRELGQLVARAGVTEDLPHLANDYLHLMMATLEKRVSRGQHANVLMHLMGYLKNALDGEDRQELLETIHQYRTGYVPLIVPITLLKHHFRRHPQPYIERQHYLNPHPRELMLRNQL